MKKLKLQPLANAKRLSRNELKNIFGGEVYGSGDCGCNAPLCSINGRKSRGAKCGTVLVVCC